MGKRQLSHEDHPWSPRTRMFAMPMPFSEVVCLTDPQRAQLEALVRAGSTPQALAFRCRLILRAAADDHPCNLQIAAEFRCDRHTVAVWRTTPFERGVLGVSKNPPGGGPTAFFPPPGPRVLFPPAQPHPPKKRFP